MDSYIRIELNESQLRSLILSSMFASSKDPKSSEIFAQYAYLDVVIADQNTLRVTLSIDPHILTLNLPPIVKNVVVSSNRISITFDVSISDLFSDQLKNGAIIEHVDAERGVIRFAIPISSIVPQLPSIVQQQLPLQQIQQQIQDAINKQIAQQAQQIMPPKRERRIVTQ